MRSAETGLFTGPSTFDFPEYMKLRPIDHKDYDDLEPFFRNQPHRLCAYSLGSVLVWQNELYHPCAAVADGYLVIGAEYTARPECRHLILPLGGDRVPSVDTLVKIAERAGFDKYEFVPDAYLELQGRESVARRFVIETQPDLDDYVYRQEDLADLRGNRYAKKRNLIHQFDRAYCSRGRVQIEPSTPSTAAECIDFLEKWCEEQGCDRHQDETLYCEKQALKNALNHLREVHLTGILFRIDGVVSALGLGSGLTEDMGVLHFEKAFAGFKGLYQYVDRECARRLFRGYRYINKESDMGVAGLAKAKKSYHPVTTVKSYRLVLRD